MWTWSLNWSEITNDIVIGTCPMAPADLRRIQTGAAVSGVLSLQHDDCLSYWGIDDESMQRTAASLGLKMTRCPIRDFDPKRAEATGMDMQYYNPAVHRAAFALPGFITRGLTGLIDPVPL